MSHLPPEKSSSDLVQWTEQQQMLFKRAEKAHCGEPLLHTPNFKLPLKILIFFRFYAFIIE